jgi:hypothetical protein
MHMMALEGCCAASLMVLHGFACLIRACKFSPSADELIKLLPLSRPTGGTAEWQGRCCAGEMEEGKL